MFYEYQRYHYLKMVEVNKHSKENQLNTIWSNRSGAYSITGTIKLNMIGYLEASLARWSVTCWGAFDHPRCLPAYTSSLPTCKRSIANHANTMAICISICSIWSTEQIYFFLCCTDCASSWDTTNFDKVENASSKEKVDYSQLQCSSILLKEYIREYK